MKKRILIIDNEPQTEEIEKMIRDAHNVGIELDCDQYNVGSTEETALLDKGILNIEKVIQEYKKRFRGKSYSLIACDWDLNDDNIDGIELLKQFAANNIWKHTPKMLYSGLLDEKINEKLELYKSEKISKDKLRSHIKLLINSDLRGFHKREDYDKQIIAFLKDEEDTLDVIVEEILLKFPDFEFKGGWEHRSFSGKTFDEVAKIISLDENLHKKFKRELIEECIAYLTKSV